MDFANARQGSETGNHQRTNIMSTFEKNANIDTILSTGLLAVAMAWVALAAAQAPVTGDLVRAVPAYVDYVTGSAQHAHANGAGVSSPAVSEVTATSTANS
jgi:hypothetical protein